MTMTMLTLNGVPVYVSGYPGHFPDAARCQCTLTWRVGNFRISTVADYRPFDSPWPAEVGPGRHSETMVFAVQDGKHPGGAVTDWVGLGAWWASDSRDPNEAEKLHYLIAQAVAVCVARGVDDPNEVCVAIDEHLAPLPGDIARAVAAWASPELRNELRVELDLAEGKGVRP